MDAITDPEPEPADESCTWIIPVAAWQTRREETGITSRECGAKATVERGAELFCEPHGDMWDGELQHAVDLALDSIRNVYGAVNNEHIHKAVSEWLNTNCGKVGN